METEIGFEFFATTEKTVKKTASQKKGKIKESGLFIPNVKLYSEVTSS